MPEDDDFVMLEPALPPLACPVSPNFEPIYCGLDSMAHNHFAPVEFLADARSIEHDKSYATITADGSVFQPSYIGTLPMILIDIAGKSVLVLVTNVLSVGNWPKTRILLSIGQWEQSLDSDNRRTFFKTDEFLVFLMTNPITKVTESRPHTITPKPFGTTSSLVGYQVNSQQYSCCDNSTPR